MLQKYISAVDKLSHVVAWSTTYYIYIYIIYLLKMANFLPQDDCIQLQCELYLYSSHYNKLYLKNIIKM